ncbi:MAG TPA: multiheme c-type cytochrome [Stellaceae bacterium]|nr:multiheme c-type cytochrome [Stellaceae bacterium]
MTRRGTIAVVALLLFAGFMTWRFVRPMNIFVVSKAFERPISTTQIPNGVRTLSAAECGSCHGEMLEEWRSSIHHAAWTDPYFQADFRFDGSQQICKNCHTPLDRQQDATVLGFYDAAKWHPILAPNSEFDSSLQSEGVTCAACHVKDGAVLGPYGSDTAPHPVMELDNPNQICLRCHVVGGNRWDTFYKMPPCGTVAEIWAGDTPPPASRDAQPGRGASGEITAPDAAALGCVECHMPLVQRPLVEGGVIRDVRQHLWRGGHDPEMVRQALAIALNEAPAAAGQRRFVLSVENIGAAHFLPTGTPDRHLLLRLRLLDDRANVLAEQEEKLVRTILWRPFIADLWDTRLPRGQSHSIELAFPAQATPSERMVEARVSYFLVDDRRRRRIGYEDAKAIGYEVFHRTLSLDTGINGLNPQSSGATQ